MKRAILIALLLIPRFGAAQGSLLPFVEGQFVDAAGASLSSGFVCTTISGTSTNLATYPTAADAIAGTNANANPVALDSAGRASIFLGSGTYRIVILNPVGTGSSTCNGTPTGSAIKTINGVFGPNVSPVSGTGTINRLPKFTAASTVGSSSITDNGTTITTSERILVGGAGTYRSDTGVEVSGATDAGISLYQASNPGVTTYETFLVMGAKDSAGVTQKTASLSSKWGNATAATGFGTLRFNATKALGADDVFMRGYGGQGIDMFGTSETVGPGTSILHVEGKTWVDTSIGIGLTPAYPLHLAGPAGVQISGNLYATANIANPNSTKGVLLGYDNSSVNGIISANGANAGLEFWTNNGSWAERARFNLSGNFYFNSTTNVGVGVDPATYPIQVARDGVQISGNAYAIASILNAASTKGVLLGYDNASVLGLMSSQGVNSGLSFWTHNGSWGERFQIATDGTLVLGDGTVDVKFRKALVAMGGGAAPTLGTIGGSGPATAGQNAWKREVDSTGVAYWIPIWK